MLEFTRKQAAAEKRKNYGVKDTNTYKIGFNEISTFTSMYLNGISSK